MNQNHLFKAIKELQTSDTLRELVPNLKEVIVPEPADDNIEFLSIFIKLSGPEGTDYKGCEYYLEIYNLSDYPLTNPKVQFLNQCVHPNVDPDNGKMCISILELTKWRPFFTLCDVVYGVNEVLKNPNFVREESYFSKQRYYDVKQQLILSKSKKYYDGTDREKVMELKKQ